NSIDCGITHGKGHPTPRGNILYPVAFPSDTRPVRDNPKYPILFEFCPPHQSPLLARGVVCTDNAFSYATIAPQGFPVVIPPNLTPGILPVASNLSLTATYDNNNLVRGYIQSWNLTVEKRFLGWIGSVGYVATRSTDQLALLDQNWSPIGGGAAGQV